MKKLAASLLALLLFGGCAISEEDLPNQLLLQLKDLKEQEQPLGNNMNKYYYTYYLPQGIGRRDSNELSEVFVKNGYRLIMNFDPSAIVINRYYKEQGNDKDKASATTTQSIDSLIETPKFIDEANKFVYKGNYVSSTYKLHNYTLQIIKNGNLYLLNLDGEIVKLYTYVPRAEVSSILHAMFKIVVSIRYDEDLILQDFSLKSLDNAKKKNLDYLEQNLPSSGSLSELLNEKDGTIIPGDSTEKEQ